MEYFSERTGRLCGAPVATTSAVVQGVGRSLLQQTTADYISTSHNRAEDEPGERVPSEMSELQEDGGQGEGDEEEGGETGQVGQAGDVPPATSPPHTLVTAGARRRPRGKLHYDR